MDQNKVNEIIKKHEDFLDSLSLDERINYYLDYGFIFDENYLKSELMNESISFITYLRNNVQLFIQGYDNPYSIENITKRGFIKAKIDMDRLIMINELINLSHELTKEQKIKFINKIYYNEKSAYEITSDNLTDDIESFIIDFVNSKFNYVPKEDLMKIRKN